jgi:hypothetical protein
MLLGPQAGALPNHWVRNFRSFNPSGFGCLLGLRTASRRAQYPIDVEIFSSDGSVIEHWLRARFLRTAVGTT